MLLVGLSIFPVFVGDLYFLMSSLDFLGNLKNYRLTLCPLYAKHVTSFEISRTLGVNSFSLLLPLYLNETCSSLAVG